MAKRPKALSGTADMALLKRIAAALERLSPAALPAKAPADGDAFVWEPAHGGLIGVPAVSAVPLSLLKGIEAARDTLLENTRRFANGLPANNALLWGARGMGKSSLVKAVHAEVNRGAKGKVRLALVEIHREEIASLPLLLRILRGDARRFLLYCDDLSFDKDDTSYKSLKAALEGGLEGRPENVLFYATSNRRHLMPRGHDETRGMLAAAEDAEEMVSVSDRFGLWIGFPPMDQPAYLAAVHAYADRFGLAAPDLERRALQWSQGRGSRSGRVAFQFVRDLAGELGKPLPI